MRSPITKWAGGKFNHLHNLSYELPEFEQYIEPFCGSASLCFHLQPRTYIINDINPDIMNVYSSIQQHAPWVYSNIFELSTIYNTTPQQMKSELYYDIRDRFNQKVKECRDKYLKLGLCSIGNASRFIFLNNACFNGLCRYNKGLHFNVPHNKKNNIHLHDFEQLHHASLFLRKGHIMCTSYENVLTFANEGDLVYLDPPILNKDFDINSYVQLFRNFRNLDKKGAHVMLSFKCNEEVLRMYENMYCIDFVNSRSSINRNYHQNEPCVIVRSWKKKLCQSITIEF